MIIFKMVYRIFCRQLRVRGRVWTSNLMLTNPARLEVSALTYNFLVKFGLKCI